MPKFIATYDLQSDSNPYGEFLTQARKLPWDCWILSSKNDWYRLPNTTLVGAFDSRDDAVAALKQARANTETVLKKKVVMEKFIVAAYDGAEFDGDVSQPKK